MSEIQIFDNDPFDFPEALRAMFLTEDSIDSIVDLTLATKDGVDVSSKIRAENYRLKKLKEQANGEAA